MSPHALHRRLCKEGLPDEFDKRNKLDLHGRKLRFWKICAEEKLKMGNRVKYHISHKDAFSAVIACRTASG